MLRQLAAVLSSPQISGPSLAGLCAALLPLCNATAQDVLFDVSGATLPTPGQSSAIDAADLDGDGDIDLVWAGQSSRIVLNDGDGVFQLGAALADATAQALGDLDGDGWIDRVASHRVSGVTIALGTGAGDFGAATALSGISESTTLGLADLNGDGDPDLITVDAAGLQEARIFLNDGTGAFTESVVAFPAPIPTALDARVGDLDGDGDVDVVLRNLDTSLTIGLNDGLGVFALAATAVAGSAETFELADMDGDGSLDIFGTAAPASLLLLTNTGTATFTDVSAGLPAISDHGPLQLLDADGDGDLDVIEGGSGGYIENLGAAVFAAQPNSGLSQRPRPHRDSTAADFDGDGDLDVAFAADARAGGDTTYLGDGTGSFFDPSDRSPQVPILGSTDTIALGDIDGDGDLDGVTVDGVQLTALLNDGNGIFTAQPAAPTTESPICIALGDIDGDNDLDALVGTGFGLGFTGETEVWHNDGRGTFTLAPGTVVAPSANTTSVALADLDGDGDLDGIVANVSRASQVLLNDGTGLLQDTPGALPTGIFLPSSIQPMDLDNDGDLDLFVSSIFSVTPILLNDGTGMFSTSPTVLPISVQATPADFDNDGDIDLALLGASIRVFRNDGALSFTELPFPPPSFYQAAPYAFDADLDGDIDLVGTDLQGILLFLNDGTGTFSDASTTRLPPRLAGVGSAHASGDIDGDGDVDLLHAVRPIFALARHLSWRASPAVGKTLELELSGRPGELWVLVLANTVAPPQILQGFNVRIDLASATTAGFGFINPSGTDAHQIPVPSNPALLGLTAYWQAALFDQGATTNVLPTTLRAF